MRFKSLYLFGLVLTLLSGCQQSLSEPAKGQETKVIDRKPQIDSVTEEFRNTKTSITVAAIGDILLHDRVYNLAEVEGGYDFMPMLEGVKPMLQEPDFLMANQESMPGGSELGLSSYPAFNSPQEIVKDLQSSGVDMVIGANNHTLDRGIDAIESALDFYDEIGMDYVGVYRDSADRTNERIVDVEGISLGVLAYTYGLNGIPIPEGHEDIVALIEPERITADVESLREKVDVVIVHMHWGDEYAREPNETQRELAQQISKAGADLIFGHHPHVLQPIELLEQEDGHETIVFYSLGNFFSGQEFEFTDIGGVGSVQVTKTISGAGSDILFEDPQIEPTLVLRSDELYRVVPFDSTEFKPITDSTVDEIIAHTEQYITE